MNRPVATLQRETPINPERCISFRDKNNSGPAFKGALLNSIGELGSKPEFSNLVSTGGFILIRPPITMADEKTPKKERTYSALWQLGMALGGLAVQLAYNKKYERFANFLSQKIFGVKLDKTELELANKRASLIEAIHRAPKETSKILKMNSKKAGKRIEELNKEMVKRSKPTVKIVLSALNPFNVFKNQASGLSPFENNPGLIREIRKEYGLHTAGDVVEKAGKNAKKLGKGLIDNLLHNQARTKQILEISGTSKLIHFGVLLTSLNVATLLVTRYMDPLMNFMGKTFNIKSLKDKPTPENKEVTSSENKDEQVKKDKKDWNWLDKTIFGTLGALALIEGVNIAGKIAGKKGFGDKFIGDIAKGINERLKIGKGFDRLMKKPFESLRNNAKKRKMLANQANVNDKWVERNVIANLLLRLLITAPTIFVFGKAVNTNKSENPDKTQENKDDKTKVHLNPKALYNTTRIVVDEAMNLTLLNAADKALIIPASIGLAKLWKKSPSNQGIKVLTDQGIKNILLVCTLMGFLNNAISRPIANGFKKVCKSLGIEVKSPKQLNDEYQEFRRRFLASQRLDQLKTPQVLSGSIPVITTSQGFAGVNKNETVFSEFMKKYRKEA